MSDDNKDKPDRGPETGDERTVFVPRAERCRPCLRG